MSGPGSINLTAVAIDDKQYAIECSECGPVGVEDTLLVNDFAFRHMKDFHHVEGIEWKIGDGEWQ